MPTARCVLCWMAAFCVLASASAEAADWTVFLRRAGPVHVGMSLQQVRAVLGDPLAVLEGNTPKASADGCAYLKSATLPERLGVMFERGRVVRIDVREAGIPTASGIQVGATEEQVTRVYGRKIRVEPHKYDPNGHYLRFVASDAADRLFGLIFETDGSRVTSYRTGLVSAVLLVEGCA